MLEHYRCLSSVLEYFLHIQSNLGTPPDVWIVCGLYHQTAHMPANGYV